MSQSTHSCSRCKPYRACLSHTRMPFGQYAGQAFDDIPLGYLDWLSGQPWCSYGEFRKRLTQYLKHPCIQRELEDLFPEEWDDSRQPIFLPNANDLEKRMATAVVLPKTDHWHGMTIPRPEEPRDWQPPRKFFVWRDAWETAALHLAVFEEGAGTLDELAEVNFDELRDACKHLPGEVVARLRKTCRDWHDRLRDDPAEFPSYAYGEWTPFLERYCIARCNGQRQLSTVGEEADA